MNKKGVQLSVQTMILIVLGLIVLVILILVIRGQIGKGAAQYFKIGESAAEEADPDKCQSGLFVERKCEPSCAVLTAGSKYFWKSVGIRNCKEKVCCERGELKPEAKQQPQTEAEKQEGQ